MKKASFHFLAITPILPIRVRIRKIIAVIGAHRRFAVLLCTLAAISSSPLLSLDSLYFRFYPQKVLRSRDSIVLLRPNLNTEFSPVR
jgi:hypothetical protein